MLRNVGAGFPRPRTIDGHDSDDKTPYNQGGETPPLHTTPGFRRSTGDMKKPDGRAFVLVPPADVFGGGREIDLDLLFPEIPRCSQKPGTKLTAK
jgi:hypothetical protein